MSCRVFARNWSNDTEPASSTETASATTIGLSPLLVPRTEPPPPPASAGGVVTTVVVAPDCCLHLCSTKATSARTTAKTPTRAMAVVLSSGVAVEETVAVAVAVAAVAAVAVAVAVEAAATATAIGFALVESAALAESAPAGARSVVPAVGKIGLVESGVG